MKKFILSLLALMLFSFMPNTEAKASALGLTALERCCLPVAGRMQRSETAACHCPPEKLCPTSIKEWNEAKLLPQSIASICCPQPAACNIMRTQMQACGTQNRIEEARTNKFCFRHELKAGDYTSKTYKDTIAFVEKNEIRLQAIREEVRKLNGTNSDITYKQGNDLLDEAAVIEALLKKAVDDANKADAKAKLVLSCQLSNETTCCISHVAQSCPPPPPDSNCRMARGSWPSMTPEQQAEFTKKCPNPEWYDCVAEGTMVLMADGSQKPIQEVRIGEFVKGYNANNRVTGLSLEEEGAAFLHSINDGKLNITAQHPILTTKGWKAISPEKVLASEEFMQEITQLMVGDEVIIPDEGVIKVTKIGNYEGPKVATYNLSVNGDKTFIANGMVIRAFAKNNTY